MNKLKTYISLILLIIILFIAIKQKHYIEKITNNFLYLDSSSTTPDTKTKNIH